MTDAERNAERERRVRELAYGTSAGREGAAASGWASGQRRLEANEAGARSSTSMGNYPLSPEAFRRRESQSEIVRPVSSFGETGDRDEQLAGHLRRLGSREAIRTSPRTTGRRRDTDSLSLTGMVDALPDSPALAGASLSPALRSARPSLPREFLDRDRADRVAERRRSPQLVDGSPRTSLQDMQRLGSPRVSSPQAGSPLAFPTTEGGYARPASRASVPQGRPTALQSPAYTSPNKYTSGRTSVLDQSSPRVRRSSLMDGTSDPRPESSLGSRASGIYGGGGGGAAARSSEHHKLLVQAFEYFELHFGATDPGRDVVSPESVELVKRMSTLLSSTTKLNIGLRSLASASQEAQVEAELDEDATHPAGLVQFDKTLHALLRVSDDQQRSLTEALLAFTRVERERDKLRREGELNYARPASRASFSSRGTSGGGTLTSPRRPQTSSPFEAGNGFSASRPGPSRQALRDPLEEEEPERISVPRRATTISHVSARSPYLNGIGTDSPTPLGRRGEALHARSPLVDDFGLTRRQPSVAMSDASSVDRQGLPLADGTARRRETVRRQKSSVESDLTARPRTPTSIRFPRTSSGSAAAVDRANADTYTSPTHLRDESRQQPPSIATPLPRQLLARNHPSTGTSADTDEDEDEFHLASQGLSSPELEKDKPSGPLETLKGLIRRRPTNEGVPQAPPPVGMNGSAELAMVDSVASSSPEERRKERRRERDQILGRVSAVVQGMARK